MLKWHTTTEKHYISKGYKFTAYHKEFKVQAKDLHRNASIEIDYICDRCGELAKHKHQVYSNRKDILGQDLCNNCTKHHIRDKFLLFVREYDYIPSMAKILKEYNLTREIFKQHYNSVDDLTSDLDFDVYNFYINKLIREHKKGNIANCKDLSWNKNKLPQVKWFVRNCPSGMIKNYVGLFERCGIMPHSVSKDIATKIVYKMQQSLGRDLIYDDFRNPSQNEIGVSTINRIWGSLNNMKKDLGFRIVQENMMVRSKTLEESKEDIEKICNSIQNVYGRKVFTINDFDSIEINERLKYQTYFQYFKESDEDMRDYVNSLGFSTVDAGYGMNYKFEDGEVTLSQYEYQFSKYLRDISLVYNVDYFKDVPYKGFIYKYDGNMTCDYVIQTPSDVIYVEIAGFLVDYNKDKPHPSKIKYIEDIKRKEEMFVSNSLNYYVLYPKPYPNENELNIVEHLYSELNNQTIESEYRKYG